MINLTDTQKKIIRILFVERDSSRSILANKLSLTNAALTLTTKPLIEEGMILDTKKDVQRVGRKELKLSLNPDYGYFVGIDVRKHHLYFTLMNFNGDLILSNDDRKITFNEFINDYKDKLLGIGITLRGKASYDVIHNKYLKFYEDIKKLDIPTYLFNNVDCLADIYSLNHNEDKNFLLIKYGPGVGSSIYVYGKPLGSLSELGHTYYQDKTVEDTISYSTLLGKELEEDEANEELRKYPELLNKVIDVLSFALINADSLLSLQKIILSGALLSIDVIKNRLIEKLHDYNKEFDGDKLCIYPDYKNINEKKSCIGAFNKLFH